MNMCVPLVALAIELLCDSCVVVIVPIRKVPDVD